MALKDFIKKYGPLAARGAGAISSAYGNMGPVTMVLNNSMRKSSPIFKASQEQPEASSAGAGSVTQTPEAEYTGPQLTGNSAGSSGPYIGSDISNSDIAHTAGVIGSAYSGKSTADLWALRNQLRRKASQAESGMLPEDEYMAQGIGLNGGDAKYNFGQLNAINNSAAGIFDAQVGEIDEFLNQIGKEKSGGSSLNSSLSMAQSFLPEGLDAGAIIRMATSGMTGTAEERAAIQMDMANALATGDSAVFLDALKNAGFRKLGTVGQGQISSLEQNIPILNQAIGLIESNPKLLTGNIKSLIQAGKNLYGAKSPEFANIQFLLETVNAPIRNKIFGASLTTGESGAANTFLIDIKKDTGETVMNKARGLQATQMLNIDRQQLRSAGLSLGQITKLEQSGALPSYYDYLKQFGVEDEYIPDSIKPKGESESGSPFKQNSDGTYTLSFNNVGGGTNSASGLEDAKRRIARNESDGQGGYNAVGPVVTSGQYKGERAVGKYQVMPGNIPAWSKEALGYSVTPEQFLMSPQIQEAVVGHRLNQYYKKYGNWSDVASAWFTGGPLAKNAHKKDVLGTSGAQYVANFNA